MKADFHMHTEFSTDSDTTPEKMAEAAIALGMETICFTDHQDIDFPGEENEFYFDTELYFQKMRMLQEKYKNQIDIRIGVEVGLQPHLGTRIHEYVNQYPFDYVIGSVHVIDGKDPYFGEMFEYQTDEAGYRRAFDVTIQSLQNIKDFDVLGHLDYVVRYGKHQAEEYSYKKFADQIDMILRFLIENGKGLEVNTAGLKYGLGFAHPHPEVLRRYKELGGEIITVGADGHKPEHIAYGFEKVNDLLKDCGFKYYTEFKGRKKIFKQLP